MEYLWYQNHQYWVNDISWVISKGFTDWEPLSTLSDYLHWSLSDWMIHIDWLGPDQGRWGWYWITLSSPESNTEWLNRSISLNCDISWELIESLIILIEWSNTSIVIPVISDITQWFKPLLDPVNVGSIHTWCSRPHVDWLPTFIGILWGFGTLHLCWTWGYDVAGLAQQPLI